MLGEVPEQQLDALSTARVKLTAPGTPLVSRDWKSQWYTQTGRLWRIPQPGPVPPQGERGAHLVGRQQRLAEGSSPVDGEPGTGYLHPAGRDTHSNRWGTSRSEAPRKESGWAGCEVPTVPGPPRTATSPPRPVSTARAGVHSASPGDSRTDVAGTASHGNGRPGQGQGILGTPGLEQGISSTHASTSGKSRSLLGKISDSSTRTKGRPSARRRDSRCCGAKRHLGVLWEP